MQLTNWEQKAKGGRFKFSEGNKSGMKNFLKTIILGTVLYGYKTRHQFFAS